MSAGRTAGRPERALRRAAAGLALGFALVIAGCAAPHGPTSEYRGAAAARVLAAGYETIYDKYIRPLEASEFAWNGIAGLNEIDPSLHITRRGRVLHLTLAGSALGDFPIPEDDDPDGWASLTTRVIATGRRASLPLRTANAESIYKAVFNGALGHLDRHSRYAGLRSARNYRAEREGFGGIGVRLSFDGPQPQIISVLPETPAARNRLRAGDVITHVDGMPTEGLDRSDVIWRLRGRVGSDVRLALRRGDRPIPVSITRELIVSPTVRVSRQGRVAVIRLSGFNQRTARNLARELKALKPGTDEAPAGIVLDLRGNPGGLLDQAVAVADAFLAEGRIVSTRGRHPDSFQLFNASGRDLAEGLPLVVLINGQSASAAEIVAAALQDRGRAVVVGSNSYGKGTVQNITRLPNEGELVLTWSRFHAPSGYALEGLGVLPDLCTSGPGDASAHPEEGLIESEILLAAWRNADHTETAQRRELRDKCPKRTEKPEEDLSAAEKLLSDAALYARALGDAPPPDVAHSKESAAKTH